MHYDSIKWKFQNVKSKSVFLTGMCVSVCVTCSKNLKKQTEKNDITFIFLIDLGNEMYRNKMGDQCLQLYL